MRRCRRCQRERKPEAYYADTRVVSDGRRAVCIDCLTNGRPPGPVPVALAASYDVQANGCWFWNRSMTKQGYGRVKSNGQSRPAHRVMWEALRGPLDRGVVLDHLCNNKRCVNPDHLDPVTNQVNMLRAWSRGSHCINCRCAEGVAMNDAVKAVNESIAKLRDPALQRVMQAVVKEQREGLEKLSAMVRERLKIVSPMSRPSDDA